MEEVAKLQLSLPRGQEESGGGEAAKLGLDANPASSRHRCFLQLPSQSHRGIPQCRTQQVCAGLAGMRGYQGMPGTARSKTRGGCAASTPEEGSAWGAEPLLQTLQHQTVTKGHFYYSIAIICARLAEPGPSWSLSLTSLGIRLWFQAGRQPRPTYQPVTFPSQLAFPPGCQQTQPRNSRGCLTTLYQTKSCQRGGQVPPEHARCSTLEAFYSHRATDPFSEIKKGGSNSCSGASASVGNPAGPQL